MLGHQIFIRAPFSETMVNWSWEDRKHEDDSYQLPWSLQRTAVILYVCEREAWLTGHSYEGKLRGFLYRRTGAFDSLASLLFPGVR